MRIDEAAALIAPAIRDTDRTWADLGAGSGTFTRALASLLPAGGRVIAVERDATAIAALRPTGAQGYHGVTIEAIEADFTTELDFPPVDGALLANSLHYVPYDEQRRVLRLVARHVRPRGRLAIVEYERRAANPWVPYPLSFRRLNELADAAGLEAFEQLGARASRYGGALYAAAGTISVRPSLPSNRRGG
ncbi:MAG TPA: class I SAM-dependent methyltransferase [Gemmatimonadaceae bacterium]|nr:class I SAM-dependent methyltransferase [Gemmatimonadaceae bacterium]